MNTKMKVTNESIKVGNCYFTKDDLQLLKVTELIRDDKNRERVRYVAKSARIVGRMYAPQGTKSNPPLIRTFVAKCARAAGRDELKRLKEQGILLEGE